VSLNKSEQSLHIEPRSSRQLAILLLVLHGMAMGVVANLDLPGWLLAGLVGSVVVMLYGSWHIYVLGSGKKSIKVMVWDDEGNWKLITAERKSIEAELLPSSFVFPRMLVLHFMSTGRKKYSTVLMPDSIDPGLFRKLLLRLRFET